MSGGFSALRTCAEGHLAHYVDPSAGRAFGAYDILGDPDRFDPTDALAPALLDAPVPGNIIIKMFAAGNSPFTAVRDAIQDLLARTNPNAPSFHTLDLTDERGDWMLVRHVLRLSDHTSGLAASKITKMLHRKRPELVPIFDTKVAAFYGTTARTPWNLWPALQVDINSHYDELANLASKVRTTDGRQLTVLRALDIIVWEHVVTNCSS